MAERGFNRFTAQTVDDPARLRRELADCRRTGTAIVREELTPRAESVATRIMDADGQVVAALSVVVRSGSVALRDCNSAPCQMRPAATRTHSPVLHIRSVEETTHA